MSRSTWAELEPDSRMAKALEFAGAEATREEIRVEVERIRSLGTEVERRRERAVLRDMRKRWSERFATACATMIANEIRSHASVRQRYSVLPDEHGQGQETFTPLGYKKGKRIDVVVTGPLVGLQVGVSLKGLNFADDSSGNHDKNLTGRLYELRDEVSTVHDYLPRAFMAIVFFLPVAGCFDKTSAPSSFAHLYSELRARTGRLDPSVAAHAWRCDYAAVGLYTAADPIEGEYGLRPGVARYFPVERQGEPNWPPERGLPRVATAITLEALVDDLLGEATRGTATAVRYAPAEGDDLTGAPAALEVSDSALADEDYDVDEDDELDEETVDPGD